MNITEFTIVRRAKRLTCQRCRHRWNYTGKNPFLATCPHCATKVTIKNKGSK